MFRILFREVWPFVKEMVFKNTNLRAVVRANKLLSYIFVMFLIVTGVCGYLFYQIDHLRHENFALNNENEYLKQRAVGVNTIRGDEQIVYRQNIDDLRSMIDSLQEDKKTLLNRLTSVREENERLKNLPRVNEADLKRQIERYQRAIQDKDRLINNLRQQIGLLKEQGQNTNSPKGEYIEDKLEWLRSQEPS